MIIERPPMEEKSRIQRIKEVCDRFGLGFEIVQSEDDTWMLILKGRPDREQFGRVREELRLLVDDDWLITLDIAYRPSDGDTENTT